MFDEQSISKSQEITRIYEHLALKHNCTYLNLEKIAKASTIDGLHYDEQSHKLIADAFYKLILSLNL